MSRAVNGMTQRLETPMGLIVNYYNVGLFPDCQYRGQHHWPDDCEPPHIHP
jgi:hypothetical protein